MREHPFDRIGDRRVRRTQRSVIDAFVRLGGGCPRLEGLLEHFRQNRLLFRRLSTGPAVEAYLRSTRELARMIAERLGKLIEERRVSAASPPELFATGLAQAWMAMVGEWLLGRDGARLTSAELSHAMLAFATGGARAWAGL